MFMILIQYKIFTIEQQLLKHLIFHTVRLYHSQWQNKLIFYSFLYQCKDKPYLQNHILHFG